MESTTITLLTLFYEVFEPGEEDQLNEPNQMTGWYNNQDNLSYALVLYQRLFLAHDTYPLLVNKWALFIDFTLDLCYHNSQNSG